ncbi:MAG: hypothetical protein ACYS8I_11210 [Planctomycetota bacterium]|jgi:hypothetical protein
MAGMFYSLEEAIAKLNMTEAQLKDLVKEGKLREFCLDSNVLYKVDEVEALSSGTGTVASEETPVVPAELADADDISLVPEATAPEAEVPEAVVPEAEVEMPEAAVFEAEVPEAAVPGPAAPEITEDTAERDELTDADTVVADEGINILGETGGEEAVDDLLSETKGTTGEASLEEIEEDVNLDTFGSGSGLLDLSLQADDTSLGGILDEIYASESEEGEETREGSALEVAVEPEQMLTEEEEFAAPEPVAAAPVVAPGYVEPEPDTISSAFGIVLFLPLLVVVYTAIVTVAGFNDVMPVVREQIQGIIWPVMAGVAVVAGVIIGVAFMLSGGGGAAGKKARVKKPKPKKARKKSKHTPEG